MRPINLIVIHCSATPDGRWTTAADIDVWHRQRGFHRDAEARRRFNPQLAAIGYHHVIYTNGATASGRSHAEIGAHAYGYNQKSLGVCLVGTDLFSAAQWDALRGLVESLKKLYPDARLCGHRDLSPDKDGDGKVEPFEWLKTCPGFDVADWLKGGMRPAANQIYTGDET